jgi:predicted Rossmann-fold nucleotide-binding protein
MPFRSVCVLSGPDQAAHPEFAEAAAAVGRLLAEQGLTELRMASSMDARRAETADLADGFLALPGGLGTLEELFAIWTWGRLGHHEKPCGLLNTADYYTSMLRFVDDMVVERFVRETQRGMLIVDRDPAALLRAMADFQPPETRRLQAREGS